MEAQTFLDNFGTIAQAPHGIEQLRQLILNLAVQGKLVEQGLGEEPAAAALSGLRETRSEFLKAKVQGRPKISRVVEDWEQTSEVPDGWSWARIDDTGQYVNGLAFKAADWQDSGIPIIRIQNLSDPSKEFNYTHGDHPADRMVATGDLLVSWSATLDVFVWDRGDGVVNQHIFKVIPEERVVAKGFLYYLLKHTIEVLAASDAAHGLAMKHINRGPFVSHPVLIPPLAEQHRIVAKVDELMALCDQLEAQQQTRTETATKLRASVLDALTTAETADELQTAWERVQTNWEVLGSNPQSIGGLRGTILDLAVRGRLVEQDPDEEGADQLLDRVSRERKRLIDNKLVPRPQRLPPEVNSTVVQFELPPGWKWARFEELASYLQRGKSPKYVEHSSVPVISQKCVQWHGFDISRARFVNESSLDGYGEERFLRGGDLLWNSTGTGTVGRVTVLPEIDEYEHVVADSHVTVIRLIEVVPKFVWIWLASSEIQNRIDDELTSGTTKQRELNHSTIRVLPLPVPPIAEQHRIVAKVDELIGLCDELEARLLERDRIGEALAASVVDAFVA